MADDIGKKAESLIKDWLDRPNDGYNFDRIPDQMTGFYGSKNIADFILYLYPNMYYIESKSTWEDRFDFSLITSTQHDGLLEKSKISGVYGLVSILFASYKRTFILDINEIKRLEDSGKHSINITKINKWNFRYCEIQTDNSRTRLYPKYIGDFDISCLYS